MVDLDGSFKYSNVLMVRKDQKTISGISVSPNPVTSGDVPVIRFQSSANNAVVTLRIVDWNCLLYTSPSPRDRTRSRMPSSA
mgnify:CR=1 FL=1